MWLKKKTVITFTVPDYIFGKKNKKKTKTILHLRFLITFVVKKNNVITSMVPDYICCKEKALLHLRFLVTFVVKKKKLLHLQFLITFVVKKKTLLHNTAPDYICGKKNTLIRFVIKCYNIYVALLHLSRIMTKPTKWPVRPTKTQISLGILPVRSVFAVRIKKDLALNYPLRAQRRLRLGGCPG